MDRLKDKFKEKEGEYQFTLDHRNIDIKSLENDLKKVNDKRQEVLAHLQETNTEIDEQELNYEKIIIE